ncbi:uncharacterized protein TNCV_3852161 [Trichonephila clavipes]|nr:uncharacterized protein TNCV_3852161 [Trichonephila clavipes]
MPVLRDTGASLDKGYENYATPEIFTDNVVVFSEGWNFSIDHMDGILEGNTRSAVRPAECELAQNGVEYRGYVVGLGKQSPAQLKRKEEFVANAVPAPVDDVGDQKRMVLRP